jgi:hypothetical protein
MKFSLRNMSLALALMVSAAPLMTVHADAKSSFMAECSAKFKAAKANDTLGADTKWTDFMKHQCAADASAEAPAEPAAKPAKAKKTKKAVDAPVATEAAATTPSGSFMQNCSASWKAMKAAGTTPAGMAWKDFVAAKCVATPAAATQASATTTGGSFMQNCSASWKAMKVAGTTPKGMAWKDFVAAKCVATQAAVPVAKPAKVKKAVAVDTTPDETPTEQEVSANTGAVKTMDKNGKPFTPGQLAAHARARSCGQKWRQEKAAGTLQVGLKWPQYWSACNTELKAAGQ